MIRKRPTSKKRGAIKAPKPTIPKMKITIAKPGKPRFSF